LDSDFQFPLKSCGLTSFFIPFYIFVPFYVTSALQAVALVFFIKKDFFKEPEFRSFFFFLLFFSFLLKYGDVWHKKTHTFFPKYPNLFIKLDPRIRDKSWSTLTKPWLSINQTLLSQTNQTMLPFFYHQQAHTTRLFSFLPLQQQRQQKRSLSIRPAAEKQPSVDSLNFINFYQNS
jgi:hypothetical protein